jgi:putative transposase
LGSRHPACLARLARIVVPSGPHHVTRRGNGRQQTVFTEQDYALYRELLGILGTVN